MFDSCICVDQDNFAEFSNEQIRVARKQYECIECGCQITPGQQYEYVCGKWEDTFCQSRTCLTCARIRKSLFSSWSYGTMWEDIHDTYCDADVCICPE